MKSKKSKATIKPKESKTARNPRTPKATNRKPAPGVQPSPQTPWMVELLHQRIAMRAYEIYEQRSRLGPLDDWLKAERDILEAITKRR